MAGLGLNLLALFLGQSRRRGIKCINIFDGDDLNAPRRAAQRNAFRDPSGLCFAVAYSGAPKPGSCRSRCSTTSAVRSARDGGSRGAEGRVECRSRCRCYAKFNSKRDIPTRKSLLSSEDVRTSYTPVAELEPAARDCVESRTQRRTIMSTLRLFLPIVILLAACIVRLRLTAAA